MLRKRVGRIRSTQKTSAIHKLPADYPILVPKPTCVGTL